MRPTYIGLRVTRYGPHVTSFADDSPGTVVVRAFRKIASPHPAITAPAANSSAPAIEVASVARGLTTLARSDSRPAPSRYVSTNTHGTGIRMRSLAGLLVLTSARRRRRYARAVRAAHGHCDSEARTKRGRRGAHASRQP